MKPINFRDLVYNIIQKEYDRIGVKEEVNEVIVDNIAHFSWDISDNFSDIFPILQNGLDSLGNKTLMFEFDVYEACNKISESKLFANYCSI